MDLWQYLVQFKWSGNDRCGAQIGMNPRICRCCGEPIAEHGNQLSRNPNVCASCSSMMDGMEDSHFEEAVPTLEKPHREPVSAKETVSLVQTRD